MTGSPHIGQYRNSPGRINLQDVHSFFLASIRLPLHLAVVLQFHKSTYIKRYKGK